MTHHLWNDLVWACRFLDLFVQVQNASVFNSTIRHVPLFQVKTFIIHSFLTRTLLCLRLFALSHLIHLKIRLRLATMEVLTLVMNMGFCSWTHNLSDVVDYVNVVVYDLPVA